MEPEGSEHDDREVPSSTPARRAVSTVSTREGLILPRIPSLEGR